MFQLTPTGHVEKFFLPFKSTFLPVWFLWAVGYLIPFVELIASGLLILGLMIHPALLALGVVLVIATFGSLPQGPLYPFHTHIFPRLA